MIKLLEDLVPYSTTSGVIINENLEKDLTYGPDLYDKNGSGVSADAAASNAVVTLVDRLGNLHSKDSIVYGYYDTYSSQYLILSAGVAEGKILKGNYVGSWDKNQSKIVNLITVSSSSGNRVNVINKLKDIVPISTSSETGICYITNIGGNVFELISAECV